MSWATVEKLSREDATNNFYECYKRWEVAMRKYEDMKAGEWYDIQVELAKAKKLYDEAYR